MSLFDPPNYKEYEWPQSDYCLSSVPIGWVKYDNKQIPVYTNQIPTTQAEEGEQGAVFVVNWDEIINKMLPATVSGIIVTVVSIFLFTKFLAPIPPPPNAKRRGK